MNKCEASIGDLQYMSMMRAKISLSLILLLMWLNPAWPGEYINNGMSHPGRHAGVTKLVTYHESWLSTNNAVLENQINQLIWSLVIEWWIFGQVIYS